MKYEIKGGNLPVVVMNLEEGEKVITQGGGMAWMSTNMKMETSTRGGVGKLMGRALSGDTLFQNTYTAQGVGSSPCRPVSREKYGRLRLRLRTR